MDNKSSVASFFDLRAWQEGHKLVLAVYKVTRSWPNDERYGLTSQTRRAASSITANIAEGFARYHFKDKVRFYYQARGSAAEVQNHLVLAKDLEYITDSQCNDFIAQTIAVSQLINGLVRSIEKQQSVRLA